MTLESEIARLRMQIDNSASNDKELDKLRKTNDSLINEVRDLTMEANILKDKFTSLREKEESKESVQVLRARNEALRMDIEKLQTQLRRLKRNVYRIEL
jgi:cell division protein FtsB